MRKKGRDRVRGEREKRWRDSESRGERSETLGEEMERAE